ncbi:MAG: SDR family NAD(P)-dependent oxidoreductase, partial [Actinomycetes bacterium]
MCPNENDTHPREFRVKDGMEAILRRVLVTGGSKGWGAAIVERFAAERCELFINFAHDRHAAESLAAKVSALGNTVHVVQADMGTEEGIDRLFA